MALPILPVVQKQLQTKKKSKKVKAAKPIKVHKPHRVENVYVDQEAA